MTTQDPDQRQIPARLRKLSLLARLLLAVCALPLGAAAGTTIDHLNAYAYGQNIGWLNGYADGTNGAVMGQWYCTGYLYSPNFGWICLGNGPTNGYAYSNASTNDWGVNTLGGGKLAGMAYGANVGWVTFEQIYGQPQISLLTGTMSGCAYGANCGWIVLSNATALLQTVSLSAGTVQTNGLPVAWQLKYFGTTNVNANADLYGKGLSNYQQYLAGLDPTQASDTLRITQCLPGLDRTVSQISWLSHPNRVYQIEERTNLVTGTWTPNARGLISAAAGTATTCTVSSAAAAARAYRVRAQLPLSN